MATVAGAGVIAAIMALSGSGQVLKTTDFSVVVIDGWPGAGSIAASSQLTGMGYAVRSGIAALNGVSTFSASGTIKPKVTGSGAFSGISTLSGRGIRTLVSKGTIAGVSALAGSLTEEHLYNLGEGRIDPVSTVAGKGTVLAVGAGVISGKASLTAKGTALMVGAGTISPRASFSGHVIGIVLGAGLISAVSSFGAVGGGDTVANKELYVKKNGSWTKIFPVASVVGDWDGGTW